MGNNMNEIINPLNKNNLGHRQIPLNTVFKNSIGQEFIVIDKLPDLPEYHGNIYVCKFIKTGTIKQTTAISIINGFVKDNKDNHSPNICNIAYTDGLTKNDVGSKIYNVWKTLIHKIYNTNYGSYYKYGAKGVKLDERWLHLKNFYEDVIKLPGYQEMLQNPNILYNFDKDILQSDIPINNRIYSKDTCMWVPWYVNNNQSKIDTMNRNNFASKYRGVTVYTNKNGIASYYVEVYVNGKRIRCGCFSNEIAAANAYNWYVSFKRDYISELNDVPYMSVSEWIKYKKHKPNFIKLLYHLVPNKLDPKDII